MRPSLQSVRSLPEITLSGESAQDLATVFHFQSKLFEPELGEIFPCFVKNFLFFHFDVPGDLVHELVQLGFERLVRRIHQIEFLNQLLHRPVFPFCFGYQFRSASRSRARQRRIKDFHLHLRMDQDLPADLVKQLFSSVLIPAVGALQLSRTMLSPFHDHFSGVPSLSCPTSSPKSSKLPLHDVCQNIHADRRRSWSGMHKNSLSSRSACSCP